MSNESVASDLAHELLSCPGCQVEVLAAVLIQDVYEDVAWLRCPKCKLGVVRNGDVESPPALPGYDVAGLPDEVAGALREARSALGATAYTASELMCRKILMHVAVDKGAPKNQSFAVYIEHLATSGFVTPPMKPWVDQIRKHGNDATHELPPVTKQRALETLAFTEQMLVLIYEMTHRAAQFAPEQE